MCLSVHFTPTAMIGIGSDGKKQGTNTRADVMHGGNTCKAEPCTHDQSGAAELSLCRLFYKHIGLDT